MAIRLYRAYSPGTRYKSVSYFGDLSKIKPEKSLTFGKKACQKACAEPSDMEAASPAS